MSRKLGVNVYAINPHKPNEVITLWTTYPAEANVFSRKRYIIDSIAKGTWTEWKGVERKRMIQKAIDNGWSVGVRLVTLLEGVLIQPKQAINVVDTNTVML